MSVQNFLKLLLLGAIWGGSFLFTRLAVPEWGPIWLIEVRFLITILALLPLLLKSDLGHQTHRYWRPLLIVGCLNYALPFALLAFASLWLSAGYTAILNATTPLFGLWISAIWLQEILSCPRILGFIIGFLGVWILVGWQAIPLTLMVGMAIAAGLLSALLYAISAPYITQRLSGVSTLLLTAGTQLGAAAILIPLLPFTVPSKMPSLKALGLVLALALLSSVIAQVLYFQLIREIGISKTLTVAYLVPIFAILWEAIFLRETITLSMVVGGGLVLFGTAIANDLFTPRPSPTKP